MTFVTYGLMDYGSYLFGFCLMPEILPVCIGHMHRNDPPQEGAVCVSWKPMAKRDIKSGHARGMIAISSAKVILSE